ncbi:unnamed protein product, partial [Pylaiella littoralis]
GPVLRVGNREHNILDTSGCWSTNAMMLNVLAFTSTHRKRSGRGARIKGREAGGRERGGAAATRTAALVCCCYLSAAYGRLAAAFTTVVVPPLPQPLVSSTHGERVLFSTQQQQQQRQQQRQQHLSRRTVLPSRRGRDGRYSSSGCSRGRTAVASSMTDLPSMTDTTAVVDAEFSEPRQPRSARSSGSATTNETENRGGGERARPPQGDGAGG